MYSYARSVENNNYVYLHCLLHDVSAGARGYLSLTACVELLHNNSTVLTMMQCYSVFPLCDAKVASTIVFEETQDRIVRMKLFFFFFFIIARVYAWLLVCYKI
jgi:hypothetical protein